MKLHVETRQNIEEYSVTLELTIEDDHRTEEEEGNGHRSNAEWKFCSKGVPAGMLRNAARDEMLQSKLSMSIVVCRT